MMIHDDFAKQNAVNCSFGIQGVRTHELNDCIRDRLVLDALAVASKCSVPALSATYAPSTRNESNAYMQQFVARHGWHGS